MNNNHTQISIKDIIKNVSKIYKEFNDIDKEVALCSNKTREIIDMGKFYYIYIPLTDEEKTIFSIDKFLLNPALRITVFKTIETKE